MATEVWDSQTAAHKSIACLMITAQKGGGLWAASPKAKVL